MAPSLEPKEIYARDQTGEQSGLGAGILSPDRLANEWLILVERRLMLPLKWLLWLLTLIYWFSRQHLPGLPDDLIFGTYTAYFMANIGFTYLAIFSGVAPPQARAFSLASLTCDVVFVSALLYADSFQATPTFIDDFYLLFILIIVRGLLVLRHAWENLVFGGLATAIFFLATRLQVDSFEFLAQRDFILRLGFIWFVFIIAWYLLESLQKQQRQLLQMRERLVRSENLAILGEVSAGIAHEINNPIGIIQACAEYIEPDLDQQPDLREEVRTIREEAARCKRIVQDLLDYASPEQSANIADLDPRGMCDNILSKVRHKDGLPISLERNYPAEVSYVRGDMHKLTQAIYNVVNNAVQAAEGRPRLTVTIEEEWVGHQLMSRILVTDAGPGIPLDELPHIFKPFYSKKKGGTGLGLPIARRILRAHHGDITCRLNPKAGCTFIIQLPAENKTAPAYHPTDIRSPGTAEQPVFP
jgi:signal transduction histidine kinase